MGNPNEQMFFATSLFLFFTLLRKAHVAQKGGVSTQQTINRQDVRLTADDKFLLTVTHTKTVQFQQRVLQWILPRLQDSTDVCCPTRQLALYLQRTQTALPSDQPLFQSLGADGKYRPLRYYAFIRIFKAHIARAGLDPDHFAGHSFRRGGATFAMDAGLSDTLIMAMGDWSSDAWLKYVAATQRLRVCAAELLEQAVASATAEPPLYDLDDLSNSEALPAALT